MSSIRKAPEGVTQAPDKGPQKANCGASGGKNGTCTARVARNVGSRKNEALALLNAPDFSDRQRGLELRGELIADGAVVRSVEPQGEVNNHVHTTYSFSPYYPAMATYIAWDMGLETVGCIDHDSLAGGLEMAEAGEYLGMATTLGFEVRVDFSGADGISGNSSHAPSLDPPLSKRKINNPDSKGIVYMVIHGVPRSQVAKVQQFLAPLREVRNQRNRAQVATLNEILEGYGLQTLDFDQDIYPISEATNGGSITERHILFALAKSLVGQWGVGESMVTELEQTFGLTLAGGVRTNLLDNENPYYLYDLLGVMKSSFLPRFFLQPSKEEAIGVEKVIAFAKEIGGIPSYAYLGDVKESPTGDKKAEAFEDSFLDELFVVLERLGFQAITYMPPRNTKEQLQRVQKLCAKHGFMQISGVDINSPRQSFHCPELLEPQYTHLQDSAWALIAHEQLSSVDTSGGGDASKYGLFAPNTPQAKLSVAERVKLYAEYGRALNVHNPEASAKELIEKGATLWQKK